MVRPAGEAFQTIWGNELRYPGDPTAPAREVINCHCVLVPDVAGTDLQKAAEDVIMEPFSEQMGLSDEERYQNVAAVQKKYKVYGSLDLPAKYPTNFDVESIPFDANHVNKERGRSIDEATSKGYIKNALFSLSRLDYDKTSWWLCYYSNDGAAYVLTTPGQQIIRTAFDREKYSVGLMAMVEEAKKK